MGQTCFNDNTAYAGYSDDGTASSFIISRDKCVYCLRMFDEADELVVKQDRTVMELLYNVSRTNDTVKHVKVTRSMSTRLRSSAQVDD